MTEDEWQPMETCPENERVLFWCIFGHEGVSTHENGLPVGRIRAGVKVTKPYYKDGFFKFHLYGKGDDLPEQTVAWAPATPLIDPAKIEMVTGWPPAEPVGDPEWGDPK